MVDLQYLFAPLLGYLLAGALKFAISCIRYRRVDFTRIGLGGIPSTHCTIAAAPVALVAFKEGLGHPAFGIGLALIAVIAIDAMDLRRKSGTHAEILTRQFPNDPMAQSLRHITGHSPLEVLAGLVLGSVIGYLLSFY